MAELSSDVIRGYTDTMILYILYEKPSYGYEIQKMIRMITNEKFIIKETTVYSAFSRLEKAGQITSFTDMSSGKKRTYYQISENGKEYYRAKCDEWILTKEIVECFIRGDRNG